MSKLLGLSIGAVLLSLTLAAQTSTGNPVVAPSSHQQKPAASHSIHWFKTYDAAAAAAEAGQKPIFILFTGTNWCPACQKLERDVISKPEFARAVGDKFVFLKAEFASHSGDGFFSSPFYELSQNYQVQYFPTLIVVNPKGKQLFSIDYQAGGPEFYAGELLKKLGNSSK